MLIDMLQLRATVVGAVANNDPSSFLVSPTAVAAADNDFSDLPLNSLRILS